MEPPPASLSHWFDRVAAAVPLNVAVEDENGSLTYGQLAERIDRMARHLALLPSGSVAVALPPSCELVAVLLAILKAGKAYVPIDPMSPPARARLIAEQFVDLPLVTTEDLLNEAPTGRRIHPEELDGPIRPGASGISLPNADPQRLAYVMFTSGSTGRPKGVQVTHANVMSFIRATEAFHVLGTDDASCLFHSYAFDFSVWEIFGALLHGARLVVPSWSTTRSPAELLTLLLDRRVTVLSQTPTALSQLLKVLTAHDARRLALRQLILGGEALKFSLLRRWFALMGDRVEVFNIYGPTEATVWVTCHQIRAEDAVRESESVLGHPIGTVTLEVVDEHAMLVPDGQIGEIVVGGPTVSEGYLAHPELTSQRFATDPATSQRRYRTGDLGFVRGDGNLVYSGRRDAQVKIRGHRVELGEIETALSRLDGVQDCVVRLDGSNGTHPRLVAYVVGTLELDATRIRQHLKTLLPVYMHPELFVPIPSLPRTINGKLDVGALPPPPAADALHGRSTSLALDSDSTVQQVCRVWETVLGTTGIEDKDSFFDAGGTSLHIIEVHARLVRTFGVMGLTMVDLLEHPTPRSLAARIETCREAGSRKADPEPFAAATASGGRYAC